MPLSNSCTRTKEGYPEGVVLFPQMLDRESFIMAYSYCANDVNKMDASFHPASPAGTLLRAFKQSRWIKLGRKLGFLRGMGMEVLHYLDIVKI